MHVPEHLWRFPTAAAIRTLAARLQLHFHPNMQDWEYEVADPVRLEEFLDTYEHGGLDDDQRFTLMCIAVQSLEDSEFELTASPVSRRIAALLEARIDLHIFTVWYWADPGKDLALCWRVAPLMRELQVRHRARFE